MKTRPEPSVNKQSIETPINYKVPPQITTKLHIKCGDPEDFSRGGDRASLGPRMVPQILPLQKSIFWQIEGGLNPLSCPPLEPPMCRVVWGSLLNVSVVKYLVFDVFCYEKESFK